MAKYAKNTKVVEFVASGSGKTSKSTTNKLAAQSTAKKWGGVVYEDTYQVTANEDYVFQGRRRV